MKELLYSVPSAQIAAMLLVSMVLIMELGLRVGRRYASLASEAFRTHVNAITGSLLGVLALLLGFTFSLALQRFDSRSEAVVEEANAIGTAYLRSDLLPGTVRSEAKELLRAYLAARQASSTTMLIDEGRQAQLLAEAERLQSRLWQLAVQAAREDPNPVTSGLFIQALNDMIDSFGARVAELNRHVPEVVLLLLYGTFLLVGGIVGYGAGVSGIRPSLATHAMVALIVVLVFIIIDLDRPRRGLIQIDQRSLLELDVGAPSDRAPPSR